MSKRLGGIIARHLDGFPARHLDGFPVVVTLGQQCSIIPGRNPPLYCTLTLIAMQGHQTKTIPKHFECIVK